MSKSNKTMASRESRIQADQEVVSLAFMEEAAPKVSKFEESMAILYGPPGIGKTSLCAEIPGHYIIDTELKSGWLERRATEVPNWPSFKAFIDMMESHPELVETVSMWQVDTIDKLISKCMNTICYEWGIMDLSEEGFARAWTELFAEVTAQIMRLKALGPGVLLVSHERTIERKARHIIIDHTRMDVSPGVFATLSNMADITMHMTYVTRSDDIADIGRQRCLVTRGDETQDAKDCTHMLPEVIKFKTEAGAVKQVLAAFTTGNAASERSKTIESSKKTAKKTTKKVKKAVKKSKKAAKRTSK